MKISNTHKKGLGEFTQTELVEFSKKNGITMTSEQFFRFAAEIGDSDTDDQVTEKMRKASMDAPCI